MYTSRAYVNKILKKYRVYNSQLFVSLKYDKICG